jgi:hypothetical protein
MSRSTEPVVDAPFTRRRAYRDKLVADLELFSPDALAMASGYAPQTGLHLPLIAVLHALREAGEVETEPQLRALRDEQLRRLRGATLAPSDTQSAMRDGEIEAVAIVVLCDARAAAPLLAAEISQPELRDALARGDLVAAGAAVMALRGG